MQKPAHTTMSDALPSALVMLPAIHSILRCKKVAVFLDYDGTLTPIVERPEWARLSEEMRQAVKHLAANCDVAVVSGRDLQDVRSLVGIDAILYAGSHGFDISGAGGHLELAQGMDYLPALDRAETILDKELAGIPGTLVERKRFAIAIHFRRTAPEDVPRVEGIVDATLALCPDLRKTGGKMIFELRPDIDWDKGKALQWIMAQSGLQDDDVVPIYIGDDLTDEDAFGVLQNRGIGILVTTEQRLTAATYVLKTPHEVGLFLGNLGNLMAKNQA